MQDSLRLSPWAAGATSTVPFYIEMPEVFATSIALVGAVVFRRVGATRLTAIIICPSNRPGSQYLFSIGIRTLGRTMLLPDIDPGPFRNGRRYLAPMNDYYQQLSMSRDRPYDGLPSY
ncbi:hypothetical protein EVAR_39409_1 [Eumeta japonica]|uniref:Uncharacterized protein n=1 Tax=Eumeta variegata TaxID=151549 RepID=A0A4C1Z114_EUMVA|nr:hypothetical protein EVAR_39409_1 [Eumeta japonica]